MNTADRFATDMVAAPSISDMIHYMMCARAVCEKMMRTRSGMWVFWFSDGSAATASFRSPPQGNSGCIEIHVHAGTYADIEDAMPEAVRQELILIEAQPTGVLQ